MKKTILRLTFGFIILPAAIAGTLYHLNHTGFFNVENIEIVYEETADDQKSFLIPLVAELKNNMADYQRVSLWSLPLSKVSAEIANYKWIETSSIKRSWPNTLTITVRPYEVKLLYMVGKSGKLLPVTKTGNFLDPIETSQAPDVALLDGEAFAKKPELRKKAVEIIAALPDEGSFSKKTVSEVRYDKQDGFWMTLIRTGVRVKIGEDQVALKASRVSQVVDYLDSHQFDARDIDANLSKKVLVKLRKNQ